MGQYDGGQVTPDGSGWQRPTSHKPGESGPAPTERDPETGTMKRSVTPDPYANGGNGHTVRNFSRNGN